MKDLDHNSDDRFVDYYREESTSAESIRRSEAMYAGILRILSSLRDTPSSLDVADIGCGPGTQSIVWSRHGHSVHGLDVNKQFIELAERRARDEALEIDFRTGTAAKLPWPNQSMDVCLVPELLEHVPEWVECLDEFTRILRPGGILYLSTSNRLCPVQKEFKLPLYSWYPSVAKRYFEKLAVTTKPKLVNYATYPAVNWFSYYQLRSELGTRGLRSLDRVDFADDKDWSGSRKVALAVLRKLTFLRLVVQLSTPYSLIIGFKPIDSTA